MKTTGTRSLLLTTSPFLASGASTPRVMIDVMLALAPCVATAVLFFGLGALLTLAVTVAGAMLTERVLGGRRGSLSDGSAAVTGLVLGLTLPPTLPWWMALCGAVFGVAVGKLVFGGLGQNLFNPALVGRAFLQAAFPTALTTWSAPVESVLHVNPRLFTLPFMQPAVDAVTAATPLARMKFEHDATPSLSLLFGEVAGSLGETSALAIVVGGLFLALRRALDWRIPASIIGTVAALAALLHAISPDKLPAAPFMVLSGGLMFGAVFMATDPVTCPTTPKGALLFGAGIGVLVVVIRLWGGLPEGVMYAVLLMNAVSPLIERYTQPRPFGRGRKT